MFAMPSFLALIVQPSAYENISRAISSGVFSAYPGSRVLMNQAFSANRQASMMNGIPFVGDLAGSPDIGHADRLASARIVCDRDHHRGMPWRGRFRVARECLQIHVAFEGMDQSGWRPSAMTRSSASAPVFSMCARVVSKWVLEGMMSPGRPITGKDVFCARPGGWGSRV